MHIDKGSPVHVTSNTGFEAKRNSVQVSPACCQQKTQEDSLHALYWQALTHNFTSSAQDTTQRALLVLVKVGGSCVVILKCRNEILQYSILKDDTNSAQSK